MKTQQTQSRRLARGLARMAMCAVIITAAMQFSTTGATPSADIRIDCAKPTVALSPHLYGLFFEDINYGADGGLYAELVQNRSFEYFSLERTHRNTRFHPLYAWQKVERGGARCELAVADRAPLSSKNTKYLEIQVSEAGTAGVSNSGFDGIATDAGARYRVSLYARMADWSGDRAMTAALELEDGTSIGAITFKGVSDGWQQFEGIITAKRADDNARLVVTSKGKGTLALDMISLMPQDTFAGRKNGLRKDLAQALKDLNPKFLRFPGGCIAHGFGLDNLYRWKDTVGDVAERKPNWNLWGYHQTYGLGFFEYFQLCEDLGMTPLPVIPVGVSCGFRGLQVVPMNELHTHITDALDLIEFAKGPVTSTWGAVRARMGHPKPFPLEYVCLGNEEHDNPQVRERLPRFAEAIRKAHPEIKIIGTSGLGPEIPIYDLMTREKLYSSDEHYYESPAWFIRHQNRFDNFDRNKPKIFVGEYAAHDTDRRNTLYSALAEAAYLTGIERNGDMVDMACYAPLFGRQGHTQWNPNLIYFDKRRVLKTANYYVQQMFGQNKGDVYLANTVERQGGAKPPTVAGSVGVGSWNTAIEIAEVTVNGRKVDPSKWRVADGSFQMKDGNYVQSDTRAAPALCLSPETFEGETVTYTVRARKTSGAEGFLLRFGAKDGQGGYWWNVGGWQNARHGIEQFTGGGKATIAEARGSVTTGQWYDLKVELGPGRIQCFLDGRRIHDYRVEPPALSVSPTLDKATGEMIIKLVNPSAEPVSTRIALAGAKNVAPKARLITLAGEKGAANTFEQPDLVKPVTSEIPVGAEFNHTVPAMALQIMRIKVKD